MFLLRGDLSGGKPWSLQRLAQPLGQQSRAVPVQTQQDLGEMLRQAAGSAASDRLRQQGRGGGGVCGDVTVYVCHDWWTSVSPAGRSRSGAFRPPAAPRPAEARPSTGAAAPPAGMNVEHLER